MEGIGMGGTSGGDLSEVRPASDTPLALFSGYFSRKAVFMFRWSIVLSCLSDCSPTMFDNPIKFALALSISANVGTIFSDDQIL